MIKSWCTHYYQAGSLLHYDTTQQNSCFFHFYHLLSLFADSARHAHKIELILQTAEHGNEIQKVLANRAINPTVFDYSQLYDKWRIEEICAENGPNVFS